MIGRARPDIAGALIDALDLAPSRAWTFTDRDRTALINTARALQDIAPELSAAVFRALEEMGYLGQKAHQVEV